ncbi:Uncharacterised protein [Candidatus Tiddalikarchaeum anstoanum]|nr:Uncharacterised protein [Candidatus Tiddalikarchaeum anstoanum]
MTVVSVAASFFWVNSVATNVEEEAGSSVSNTISACSSLNLISMKGDEIVVQNTGCNIITNVTLLIDGVLTSYGLSTPLAPGDTEVIAYSSLSSGQDHCVKVMLGGNNQYQTCSSAVHNTLDSGYGTGGSVGSGAWYSGCSEGGAVVDFSTYGTSFSLSDSLGCGCSAFSKTINALTNGDFENGSYGWNLRNATISSSQYYSGGSSVYVVSPIQYGDSSSASQQLDFKIDTASFMSYLSSGYTGAYYQAFRVEYHNNSCTSGNCNYGIMYMLSADSNLLPYCDTHPGDPNTWIDCSVLTSTVDAWIYNSINNIAAKFSTVWPSVDFNSPNFNISYISFANQLPFSPGNVAGYFDDVFVNASADGRFCDSSNSGLVDGVCQDNICNIYSMRDTDQNLCNNAGYVWFTGSVTGSNGPCCSNGDTFYNSTMYCDDGGIITQPDSLQAFCTGIGKTWLTGSITGLGGRCCEEGDYFYDNSLYCNSGSIGEIIGEGIPLVGCRNITSSGVYNLQFSLLNVNTTCFNINSNDVVFNGRGNNIDGNYVSNKWGVYAEGNNISINNITIRFFKGAGQEGSIYFSNSANLNISYFYLYNNSYGILFNNVTDSLVVDEGDSPFIDRSVFGVYLNNSNNNVLNRTRCSSSGISGYYLMNSNYNNLTYSHDNYNTDAASIILNYSSFNLLQEVMSSYNNNGLQLFNSNNNTINSLMANYNTRAGYEFTNSSYNFINGTPNGMSAYNVYGMILDVNSNYNSIRSLYIADMIIDNGTGNTFI